LDILIVGGNSFIGSNLQSYLLSRDQEINVINLDEARNTRMEEVMGFNQYQGRYSFKEGGICDLSSYEHYLKVSDLVINCSSIGYRPRFREGMGKFIRTNILGARMLADSACRFHIPLMHISSDEVYGSCPFTVHRRDETSPLDPTNSFAATLAAGERLVSLAGKKSGNPIVIARPCELIGPNQDPDRIIPRTIHSITGGRPPVVREKGGERYRDWLHVLDLCSALHILMESISGTTGPPSSEEGENVHSQPGGTVISGTSIGTTPSPPPGKTSKRSILSGVSIFNITSEMRYPITEIVERTMRLMGSVLPLQETSGEGYRDLGYNPSGKKISYQGWQARYDDIDGILLSTIEWYKDNPDMLNLPPSGKLMP
jgi:dTDP-glucose 4,6-dehydratase